MSEPVLDAVLRFVEDGGSVSLERGMDSDIKACFMLKADTGQLCVRSTILSSPGIFRCGGMQDEAVRIAIRDLREVVARAEGR